MPTGMTPWARFADLNLVSGVLAVASGGTGATTAAGARANLGIGAGGGNADIVEVLFDFSSSTPLAIGLLNVGDTIEATEIQVETAFDGTNPTASIGTGASPALYQPAVDLSEVTFAPTEGAVIFSTPTNAILTLSLGGSTTGAGRCSITISRA